MEVPLGNAGINLGQQERLTKKRNAGDLMLYSTSSCEMTCMLESLICELKERRTLPLRTGARVVWGPHRSLSPVRRPSCQGQPLERAAARICKEAGPTVAMNVRLRDLNVDAARQDERRIEVIANGLVVSGLMKEEDE